MIRVFGSRYVPDKRSRMLMEDHATRQVVAVHAILGCFTKVYISVSSQSFLIVKII